MTQVKSIVSDVLMREEDIEDSLEEIKLEMIVSRDELKKQLMKELNGAMSEALVELA